MTTIYSGEYANIIFDDALNALFLKYKQKVPSHNEFVTLNLKALEEFKKLDTDRFFVDIRKMGIISIESQQWVVTELIPAMIKSLNGRTLIHAQLLDSKEIMSKVSANNIKKKATQKVDGLELTQFASEEELRAHFL